MKRPMILTACIFGIVCTLLTIFASTLSLFLVGGSMESMISDGLITVENAYFVELFLYIFYILILALSVVGFIFNVLIMGVWNKSSETFKANRGKIITALILNFIVAELSIVVLSAFGLVTFGLLLSAGILMIVSLVKEKKNFAVSQETVYEIKEEIKQAEDDDFERKLIKLNEMKNAGIITEEEYQAIKSKYISEKFGL